MSTDNTANPGHGGRADLPGGTGTVDVVFLHPAGRQPDSWTGVVRSLPAEVKPWLPNLGRGGVEEQRAAVESFLDRNELRRVVLVGHAMGAVTAVAVAAAQPQRVTGLVLSQPQLFFDPARIRGQIRAMKFLPRFLLRRLGVDKASAIASLEQVARVDLREKAAAITAPTLILATTTEQVSLKAAEQSAELIPDAVVKKVPGMAGIWYESDPERFVAEISPQLGIG